MRRRSLLTAAVSTLALASLTAAAPGAPPRQLLLAVDFAPRAVAQVEIGDFRFAPGQLAPVHTHAAPAIGVVTQGTILYQVESQAMQVLKPGDAFYEPVGPRILHFDNASASQGAVFIDFNLEQAGEPFIVFPTPPTERIDRRSLPTHPLGGITVGRAEAYAETVQGRGAVQTPAVSVLGYVLEGRLTIRVEGQPDRQVGPGQSYHRPVGRASSVSAERGRARLVSFELR